MPRWLLLGHVRASRVLPGRDEAWYIGCEFGWSTSIRVRLVTGSLLFPAPQRSGIMSWLLRVLVRFMWWTVVGDFRLVTDVWWTCDMATRSADDGTGEDATVGGPVPSESRRSGLTHSD